MTCKTEPNQKWKKNFFVTIYSPVSKNTVYEKSFSTGQKQPWGDETSMCGMCLYE